MGKGTSWRFNTKYDPYAKAENPNSDFAFYGTLAKELAQGDLLGVKNELKNL